MWTADPRCAYYDGSKDDHGDQEHHFLLFYANDSVVLVTMARWEDALDFDHRRSPVVLIEGSVNDFHCEPEEYDTNTGVDILRFAGDSLIWRNRYSDPVKFERGGTQLIYGSQQFTRIKCWNRIVRPRRRFPRWSAGCSGETIR